MGTKGVRSAGARNTTGSFRWALYKVYRWAEREVLSFECPECRSRSGYACAGGKGTHPARSKLMIDELVGVIQDEVV